MMMKVENIKATTINTKESLVDVYVREEDRGGQEEGRNVPFRSLFFSI